MRRATVAAGAVVAGRAALRRARALDLTGSAALVTGGSRGLGFGIARELGRRGARVSICARGAEALERAESRLRDEGIDVHAMPCDVADPDQVGAWVDEAAGRFGGVDVLVNIAGVIAVGPLPSLRREDFVEGMDIMFYGVLHPTLAVLPRMRAAGRGVIANVTSIGGKVAVPHLGSYTPAKFAAVGLSEGMHAELRQDGIHVVTVVPGLMRTGSYAAAFFKGDPALEYTLFAPAASSPLNTVAGERAARRVVKAIRLRETEVTIGLHAKALRVANGVAPGVTADVLALVARILPSPEAPVRSRGDHIDSPVDDSFLTALGRRAAKRLNQPPD
jgi:NAD(P)-dependent dehydrogenase (short-subunit alcohol dehydrogenase family)